jgi:hypothetical protein
MYTKEKDIEHKLFNEMKAIGGKAYKFVSPGNSGVPDRICIFPNGRVVFVEVKAPGAKGLTALQESRIKELKKLGCNVGLVNDYDSVKGFMLCEGKDGNWNKLNKERV